MTRKIQTGIYTLRRKDSEMFYVGSTSRDFEIRKDEHFNDLRAKRHRNAHLQNIYNKHGEDIFYFQIEERIADCDEILDRENDWIAYYKPLGLLYNMAESATAPFKGRKHTLETLKKMSKAQKGRKKSKEQCKKMSEARKGKKASKETRRKQSEASKGKNNPIWGKKRSEKTRNKISEARKGKKASKETRRKQSEVKKGKNNPNYNKITPKETRQKISKSQIGVQAGENNAMFAKFGSDHPASKQIKQLDKKTGKLIKIWDSMADVQRQLGINQGSISKACRGKIKTAGGFRWEYV